MPSYDVIVVGAGSAGAVIASRLTEDADRQVLLLEAGGSDRNMLFRKPGMVSVLHTVPQVRPRWDWEFSSTPQPTLDERRMCAARGKLLGGSSAVNGMLFVRGNRSNYDGWAAEGCDGWSYDEVLPYFKKLEDWEGEENAFRGKGGPIQVSRPPEAGMSPLSSAFLDAVSGTAEVPILDDYNAEEQEGVARVQMSARGGLRYSTAVGYLDDAMKRPNLTVVTGALVEKVLLEGTRAVGVRYAADGTVSEARATGEVVLSAGAFGSPQILMRSGIGPAGHLGELGVAVAADLPVGENLQDHLFFPLTFLTPRGGHRGTPMHFFGGMLASMLGRDNWFNRSVFETIAFLKTDPSLTAPDLQLHCLPWAYPANQDDHTVMPEVDTRPALTVQPTLIYPKSTGSFRLPSTDPAAKPLIDYRYLNHADDVTHLLRGIELTREIMAHESIRGEVTRELEPGPDVLEGDRLLAELRYRVSTVYHPVGTCRMGITEDAVVTPDLKVRGIEGLRVADASVFPSITGGNTNIPTIMLGEKAADLIAG